MKCDVPLDLLHRLVDVAVEHGHGAKALEVGERLRAVVRPPSPVRVHRPQRDVREHDDRRVAAQSLHVILEPFELVVTEGAKPARFEVEDVDQGHKMNTVVVEAIPTVTTRLLAIACEVLFAVVVEHVVLARDVVNVLRFATFEHLFQRVEFARLGQVTEVARVQEKRRRRRQRIDPVDGHL